MSAESRTSLVLVADDSGEIRELVRTRLEMSGYETLQAEDGHQALAMLSAHAFTAVILDVNMPGLDGFQVLGAASRLGRPLPPTLMLTSRDTPADLQKAIRLGAKDFLSKPFDGKVLLRRIARLRAMGAAASSAPERPPRQADSAGPVEQQP